MRFRDFFTGYKIGLSRIKGNIPFKNLPRYRQIAICLILMFCTIGFIFLILGLDIVGVIMFFVDVVIMFCAIICDNKSKNLEIMLGEHYTFYSEERMQMIIRLLRDYGIDISDDDSINLLIDEAKIAQAKSDYFAGWEKRFKIIGTTGGAIIGFIVEKIVDNSSLDEMLIMAAYAVLVCVAGFAIAVLLINIGKELCYSEYRKYDELIYDLRQVKIFYSKKAAPFLKPQNSHAVVHKRKVIKETEKSETDRKANALRSVLHNIFEKIKSWRK